MTKHRPKILIVEDDTQLSTMLSAILSDEGYHVDVSTDGIAALNTILSTQPDLLILDIELPGMDGLSMLKELRAMNEFAQLPVIILSNSGTMTHISEALTHNIVMYLVKSDCEIEHIVQNVNHVLKKEGP